MDTKLYILTGNIDCYLEKAPAASGAATKEWFCKAKACPASRGQISPPHHEAHGMVERREIKVHN